MNGPEHYREALRLVEHSKRHTDTNHEADRHIAVAAAGQAQVHATLALVCLQAAAYTRPIPSRTEHGQVWLDIAHGDNAEVTA